MQFTTPKPNVFESDTGFSVEVTPGVRLAIIFIYRENGRTLKIDGELQANEGAAAYNDLGAKYGIIPMRKSPSAFPITPESF